MISSESFTLDESASITNDLPDSFQIDIIENQELLSTQKIELTDEQINEATFSRSANQNDVLANSTAELLVTEFVAYDDFTEPFAEKRTVMFTFDIYNIGDETAYSIPVDIYVDGVWKNQHHVNSIDAGYAERVLMQIIGPTSGKHSIKLVVNEDQSIPEKDYTNNSLSRSFTWVSQSQVVDFVADSLERDSSTEIITGTPTNFTLGVANAGGTTSTVVVGVAVNGTLAGAFETAQIGPNQGRYYTFEIQFKTPGKADIDLVVDPHDYIKEWNEVNNIVGDTFVVNPSTDPAVVYGSLGFSYPLPSIYTQIYADYEKHGGLDIAAPEGTEIYSVYDGYVALAGAKPANGNPWDSRGYYVVVVNDVKDPFNGNNIISQYYHMCQRPEVVTGANVSQHELLGYVGLTGSFVGDDPVNHLHIEFNNLNYIGHGVGPEERIEPKYFWPHIKFTYLNSEANTQKLPENFYQDVFEGGNYFDSNLILLVGVDVYEEWVSSHPDPNVYQFISDMGITKEELKDFLTKYVYEEYMKNWPSTVEE